MQWTGHSLSITDYRLYIHSLSCVSIQQESNPNNNSKLSYDIVPNRDASACDVYKLEELMTSTISLSATNAAYDYPSMDDEYRSDEVDLPKTMKVISNCEKAHFLPQHDEDYDYDCPYWSPSNMEQELIAQFRNT